MTTTRVHTEAPGRTWAAVASLGAGAVHATAVGAHGEHRAAAIVFGLVALAQVGWGAAALAGRAPRWLAWAGLAVNGGAIAGWLLAKTVGITFVAGLDAPEAPEFADTAAAFLALVAVGGTVAWLTGADEAAPRWVRPAHAPLTGAAALLVLTAMVATGGHSHAGGHDGGQAHGEEHAHGEGESAAAHEHADGAHDDHDAAAGDHDHDDDHDDHDGAGGASGGHDHRAGSGGRHGHDGGSGGDHDHSDDAGPADPGDPGGHGDHGPHAPGHDPDPHMPGDPGHDEPPPGGRPYDATLPVDLGGFPGVTAEQQASAEALVTATLTELPRFADPADAVDAGYRSIGDGFTGYEHYVNWPLLSDGRILDARYPESLVYRVNPGGSRTLTAAMYMLEPGSTLATVPDVGGPMVQWHIHNDLCFEGAENAWTVRPGLYPPGQPCPGGSFRTLEVPMVHVWIVPHPCGPFAALEGASGGQVGPGEEVLCDQVHGSAH
jgi:hypothetical protein